MILLDGNGLVTQKLFNVTGERIRGIIERNRAAGIAADARWFPPHKFQYL